MPIINQGQNIPKYVNMFMVCLISFDKVRECVVYSSLSLKALVIIESLL